jgi:hypothetical protein
MIHLKHVILFKSLILNINTFFLNIFTLKNKRHQNEIQVQRRKIF